MVSALRSWRSGTALLARPMVPLSRATSQPPTSRTSGGATAATVSRSSASISAGPKSALVPHESGLVALPVALGDHLALVVRLLAGGDGDLQLRHALVVPAELGGDQRAALALLGAEQAGDLLPLE